VLSTASYHLKLAYTALARITYLIDEPWHSTSTIYDQYCKIIAKNVKPLTYRRISELLTELENTGLTVSHTASKGRQGYGTQYKLTLSPEIVGNACFPDFWKKLEESKKQHELNIEYESSLDLLRPRSGSSFFKSTDRLVKSLRRQADDEWKDFVDID